MFEHYHRKSARELLNELARDMQLVKRALNRIIEQEEHIMSDQQALDAALDAFGGEITQLSSDINALVAAVQQTPQAGDLTAEVSRLQAFQSALAEVDAQAQGATPPTPQPAPAPAPSPTGQQVPNTPVDSQGQNQNPEQ